MTPADDLSKILFSRILDGRYNCAVTKAKLNGEAPDEIRRLASNSLYWAWNADFSQTTVNGLAGNSINWWHRKFKVGYLMPMYCASDPGYAAMFTAMELVLKECGNDTYQNLFDGVVNITTTTKATVQQFRLYLEQIERFAHENGVVLRTDAEIYRAAMGFENSRISAA